MKNLFGGLQKIGKAFMLPIAVLPVASLFLRLGAVDVLDIPFIHQIGKAVFDNLAILFAIGVAVGLAKENHGAAGLAGVVSYLTITYGLKSLNDELNMGILAGIVAGLVAGSCYNKFHNVQMPDWLGFFGGKRFVPIISSLISMVLAFIFSYLWIYVQQGIELLSQWIMKAGAFGVFIFGTLNRLLIPTGLHHIINNLVWFVFGRFEDATGDLSRYFAGDPNAGIFMAGFYPIMMFGLPAAALAMYHTARKENKSEVGGVLFSLAFTSFLTGITEPLEFLFMFLAPVLYGIHALFTGISMAITYMLGIRHGFGFSAGFIDYVLSFGLATKPLWLLLLGIGFASLYYIIFKFAIIKWDLATPGRTKEDLVDDDRDDGDKSIDGLAAKYIVALGGADNLLDVDACITRLRLKIKDGQGVQQEELKRLGAAGIIEPAKGSLQVVIGPKAEILASAIKKILT